MGSARSSSSSSSSSMSLISYFSQSLSSDSEVWRRSEMSLATLSSIGWPVRTPSKTSELVARLMAATNSPSNSSGRPVASIGRDTEGEPCDANAGGVHGNSRIVVLVTDLGMADRVLDPQNVLQGAIRDSLALHHLVHIIDERGLPVKGNCALQSP